jgi:hypothetical protein
MRNISSEIPNQPQNAVEVYYNNTRLLPAPLISWTVEPEFDSLGIRRFERTRLSLDGAILIVPSGSYEQLFVKQSGLRDVFSQDFKDFVILAGNGNKTYQRGTIISSGLKPKVISVNIEPDIQVNKIKYAIELEALVAASGASGVVGLSNQWSFRENSEDGTVTITHNVSAEGPDGQPDKFEQAFRAVKDVLGIGKLPIQIPYFVEPNASGGYGIIHPSNPFGISDAYEIGVSREETADPARGSYSATEIFVFASGAPFFTTSKTFSFDENENGVVNVGVQGTVQGLGRTIRQQKFEGGVGFERASSGFINHIKPKIYWEASGVYDKYRTVTSPIAYSGLIPTPVSFSVTENRLKGTVGFNFSFTDNVQKILPSGIASKTSSVNVNEAVRVFATHPIPYRRLGNIVQDIKTTTEGSIGIQCQVQAKFTGDPTIDTNRAIGFAEYELNRLRSKHANPANYQTVRVSNLSQQIDDRALSCNVSLELIFTSDLVNSPNPSGYISLRSV